MGTFSTLPDTNQVKCLGKDMRTINYGDLVQPFLDTSATPEFLALPDDEQDRLLLSLPAVYRYEYIPDFTFESRGPRGFYDEVWTYAVRDGRFIGGVDFPYVIHFDNYGNSIGEKTVYPFEEPDKDTNEIRGLSRRNSEIQ